MADLRKGKSILYAKECVVNAAIAKVANEAAKSAHDAEKLDGLKLFWLRKLARN